MCGVARGWLLIWLAECGGKLEGLEWISFTKHGEGWKKGGSNRVEVKSRIEHEKRLEDMEGE